MSRDLKKPVTWEPAGECRCQTMKARSRVPPYEAPDAGATPVVPVSFSLLAASAVNVLTQAEIRASSCARRFDHASGGRYPYAFDAVMDCGCHWAARSTVPDHRPISLPPMPPMGYVPPMLPFDEGVHARLSCQYRHDPGPNPWRHDLAPRRSFATYVLPA